MLWSAKPSTDQSGYIVKALCNVSASSPLNLKHLCVNLLSKGNCILLAKCCPPTNDLMTTAIFLCLCTLINGSRCMQDGSGARQANTSGRAGASKLPVMGSIPTASLGAVGSIRSGSLLRRHNWERYTPIKGIQAVEIGGAVAFLFLPDWISVPPPDEASEPCSSDCASTIDSTALRMNLKSSAFVMNDFRSLNIRFSHIPIRFHDRRVAFVTHSFWRPVMMATTALKLFIL